MPLCEARSDFYRALKHAMLHNKSFYLLDFGELVFGLEANY